MRQLSRRTFLHASGVALASVSLATPALADFPDHAVKWIVPFPAGGGMDTVTRLLQPKLAQALGQNVIVDNKSGGSGLIGVMAMVNSKPDGHTLMMHAMGFVMNSAVYRSLPYDPVKDIQPVAIIGSVPVVIAIGPKIEANSLKDFIALAKKNPRRYKGGAFATGAGTLMLEMFRMQAGIEMPIVPYRGVADAVAATAGGETDVVIMDGTSVVPHIKGGRLKGIAVAGPARLPEIGDVPTTTEAGLPDFTIEFWYAAFVRGGTPKAFVERLNADLNKAATDPEVMAKLKAMELVPANRSAAAFEQQWLSEMKNWEDVLKKSDFKPIELGQ